MSLVYEALQKAEREKERKTGSVTAQTPTPAIPATPIAPAPVPPPTRAASAPPASAGRPANHYFAVALFVLGVLAFVTTGYFVVVTLRNVSEKQRLVPPTAPVIPAAQPAPTQSDLPPVTPAAPLPPNSTANDPRFKLTGIMKMGESFGAVINGRIVYEEHYVDGAIVKKVERDRVTLNVDGVEAVLRLY